MPSKRNCLCRFRSVAMYKWNLLIIRTYNLKQVMAEQCLAQVFAKYAALIKGKFFEFEFFVIAFSDVEYFLYACSCSHVPESVLVGSSPVRALLLG